MFLFPLFLPKHYTPSYSFSTRYIIYFISIRFRFENKIIHSSFSQKIRNIFPKKKTSRWKKNDFILYFQSTPKVPFQCWFYAWKWMSVSEFLRVYYIPLLASVFYWHFGFKIYYIHVRCSLLGLAYRDAI